MQRSAVQPQKKRKKNSTYVLSPADCERARTAVRQRMKGRPRRPNGGWSGYGRLSPTDSMKGR
jgi:hypothetical protein